MRLAAILLTSGFLLGGCASHPATDPLGQKFPRVEGTSLSGKSVVIPDDFTGKASLLVVGFKRKSQFDIDRWLLGLSTKELQVPVYEVPSIVGFFPGLFASGIDDGMRSGIPSEDWSQVVTVYDDASKVARFTGNENGLPGRVLLLDKAGHVRFFHDRGFSVSALGRLVQAIGSLQKQNLASRGQ